MNSWMNRVKSGLRRMGDWVSGADVAIQPPPAELLGDERSIRPDCDVWERDDDILVIADVPGARPETTWVSSLDGQLTVVARADAPPASHRFAGDTLDVVWYTRFALPTGVDDERIEASLRDGVLTVTLPKQRGAGARRIAVSA